MRLKSHDDRFLSAFRMQYDTPSTNTSDMTLKNTTYIMIGNVPTCVLSTWKYLLYMTILRHVWLEENSIKSSFIDLSWRGDMFLLVIVEEYNNSG